VFSSSHRDGQSQDGGYLAAGTMRDPPAVSPAAASISATPGVWRDAQVALSNAIKIGGSLIATWTVALAVRFVLPRQLGPELYGVYNFSDAYAASFLVVASLGIETYVQKEIPVRSDHASDFLGGILALRLTLGAALIALMAAILHLGGRPPEVRVVVYLFAIGQLFLLANATFSALLHARGTVNGLSVATVLTKLLWGGGILLAVATRSGLIGLAGAFAFAEATKSFALLALCRKHLALEIRLDLAATRRVVICSFPFFVTTVAITLFNKLDGTLIGFLANDREVGWFGLASNLSQLALLMTPLVGSVLLPLFSRVAARSEEQLDQVMRRSLETILTVAVPASLALGLGADVWIRLVGGAEYTPAVLALRILSPVFVLTYVAMFCANSLYLTRRSWRVTWVCIGGLLVNAMLNVALIRPLLGALGPGGAGVGAAVASIATEVFTCGLLVLSIGRRMFDARLVSTTGKLLGVCAAVIALDRACASLGPSRLLLDVVAYCALALKTKAVRIDEICQVANTAIKAVGCSGRAPA
jgi:O-antigen/teichoic acid export membrane protein